jgi:hypothetical protein
VGEAYERYRRPIFVGETSHIGAGRAEWLREMTDEMCMAVDDGVPLEGACLYPILDRFSWDDPAHWHNSGLWDLARDGDGRLIRILNQEYAAELQRSRARLTTREADSGELVTAGQAGQQA